LLEYFLTVLGQIFTMALMVVVGYIMFKAKMLSEKGIKELSVLLLRIVTPMILVSSFQRPFDKGLLSSWIIMLAASALIYFIHIIIAELIFAKRGKNYAENKLSLVLPNNGFFAFPLLQALVGEYGIFYGSANVILFNILLWTYGSRQMKPGEKFRIKNILLNPGVIGIVLGLILFCSPYKLPAPVFNAISSIGALNTPLAMIVLGGMLAQTDLKKGFSNGNYYLLAGLKLLIIPFLMMIIFKLIPISDNVKLVSFICSATPTATAVGMIAQIYDKDYRYATAAVVIITALSAVTLPIMLTIGKGFLGY